MPRLDKAVDAPARQVGDVLDASHEALRTTARAVPADGWHLSTPCAGWAVAQVFQHAVGDQIGYAVALMACGLDALVHAWDIAVAKGRPSPLTPEPARPLLKVAGEIVEPLRPRGA